METSTVQCAPQSDYLEIPSWVNRPYEQRKAQEKERLIQEAKIQEARAQKMQNAARQRTSQGRRLERQPVTDTFVKTQPARKKGKRAKKSTMPAALATIGSIGTAVALALTLNAPKALDNNRPAPEVHPASAISAVQLNDTQQYNYEDNAIITKDNGKVTTSDNLKAEDDYIEADETIEDDYSEVVEETVETPSNKYHSMIEEEYIGSGSAFLEELKQLSGDAVENYHKLCDVLGMTEEETADYLTQLCESKNWANGVTYPSLLLAQISKESKFNPEAIGDGGLALGLGQFHTCAVDEVNNRFNTNYTYNDRKDPHKALEMMALLLRYDYSQTQSTYGMLAMYNQGHPSLDTIEGQSYVKNVLGEIGMPMA